MYLFSPKIIFFEINKGEDEMSMGYGGWAKKTLENEISVTYDYCGYNWSIEKYRNENYLCDGIIEIKKSAFVEPIIREKIKKIHGRKKIIVKRIKQDIDLEKLILSGDICVINCSNSWSISQTTKVDYTVYRLLHKIFDIYQEEGNIPENSSFLC